MENEEELAQPRQPSFSQSMHNYGSNIVFLTNTESELRRMEMSFRNMVVDSDGNIQQKGAPLMNEFGISCVLGVAQSVINRITILNELQDSDIDAIRDYMADTLAIDLMINSEAYGIISLEVARDKIYTEVVITAHLCMKRAAQGGDRRFWKGSVLEQHTKIEGGTKKSWLGAINPWGGK